MSDVSNSIRLNDYMSSTLRVINSTMELTIGIMERLNLGLLTLGMGGGLNGMNGELSAVMARIQVLEAMITSIGTGAGPAGSEVLARLNQQAMESQARIAQLEAQLLLLGNGGGGAGGAEMARLNQALLEAQARIIQLDARLEALGSGGPGASAEILRLNQALLEAQARIAQLDARLDLLGRGNGGGAAGDIARLNNELAEARARIQLLENQLNGLNNGAGRVGNQFGGWAMKLTGVFSALQMIQMVAMSLSRILNFTDQFTNANARLDLINDNLQTQQALQDDILRVSNDTGSSYKATADLVAKIGMTGAMDSTKSSIDLAEKVNKLLAIGGGGTAQNEAALLQFSQSLASGRMQGDEFRSLKENAPALMNTIAQGIGTNAGGMRQMATEGKLTTEVIIGAMENMGTTIDEQFARMPRTFGFNMQVMKNTLGVWLADMAEADGALGKLNATFTEFAVWIGSEDGSQFLSNVADHLNVFMLGIQMAIDGLQALGGYFAELAPLADALFYTAITVGAITATKAIWGMVAAMGASIAAFIVANPVIAVVALTLGFVTAAVRQTGATMADVIVGAIGGWFNFIDTMWGVGINLKEILQGMGNAVNLFLTNAIMGFQGLINDFIGGLNSLSDAVKMYTGVDMGHAGPANFGDAMKANTDRQIAQNAAEIAQDRANLANGRLAHQDKLGEYRIYWEDKLGKKAEESAPAPSMPGMAMNNIGTVDKVGKVGKIDSDVNIADEDMKMLMDLAIQNRVNQINLTVNTAAPVINQNNTVNNGQDLGGVVDTITKGIKEARQVTVAQDY